MVLPDRCRLGLLGIALTGDDIRAAGVETAAGWGINWTGGFTRDNQSLPRPVRRVRGGDSAY